MLGKLLKYEFKCSWKEFVVTYGIFLFTTLILGTVIRFLKSPLLISMFVLSYITAFLAINIVFLCNLFRSLWTKMYGAEGQLYLTIPVTTDQLLMSKLIVNIVWGVASTIVFIVSIVSLILFFGGIDFPLLSIPEFANLWIFIFPALISAFYSLMLIVLVVSVVNVGFLKNNRLIAAIILYLIFTSFIDVILQFVSIFPFGIIQNAEGVLEVGFYRFRDIVSGRLLLNLNAPVVKLALSVGYYFITRYLLKKQLSYVTP